jgi:hypothetical protein
MVSSDSKPWGAGIPLGHLLCEVDLNLNDG